MDNELETIQTIANMIKDPVARLNYLMLNGCEPDGAE